MCGIAGALFWRHLDDGRDPSRVVSAMVEALRHRGPDGHGIAQCAPDSTSGTTPSVVLGHTRLAILDLSDRGAQPMQSRRGPFWITFNGEVYNFHTLRRELEARGRQFESTSDTEVILQAYEEWGDGMVDRLQGMFAFAIWDGVRNRLLIARDRIGIKPVYFYRAAGMFLFASEIRSLLASGLVERRLDSGAVDQYLAYQTVPPPRTLVKNVSMLLPGHTMVVGPGPNECTDRQYWDWLDDAPVTSQPEDGAATRAHVRELLAESAALHLISDVPVGIFLSGGIDSSALVALTHNAGVVPRTFSVVLPGSPHDEAPFAREVAERFHAEHTEIPLAERDFRDQLPDALTNVDHPSADGLNTFVVARAVRATGIKVALSGLGGDEVFGGYPSFRRMRRLASYRNAWRRSPAPVRSALAAAVRVLGRESVASAKAAAVLESDGTVPQAFPVLRQLFSPVQRHELLGDAAREAVSGVDPYVALLEDAVRRHPDVGVMSLVSYAEARTYMHDVLLRDTDQMSMAHGLEVRVPLLDHRLMEYVLGLPDAAKEPDGAPKRLLVESLGDALPVACVQRPKQGFTLPFDTWMKHDLREFCDHHLGPDGLEGRGVLRAPAVRALWESFLSGARRTTWSRPWALVALNAWMEVNGISA